MDNNEIAVKVKENLAASFIRCRKMQNMTQQELANRSGVARPNIARFESGKYNPTVDFLVKISGALGKKLIIELKD